MATTPDPSILEPLRAAAVMLDGLRRILLGLAARLGGEPAEAESEAPEEGAALLGSELRCIIEDTLVPAIRRLEALIEEWAPADA
jgi:hypothetical protein